MIYILATGQESYELLFFSHSQNDEYLYTWELSSVKKDCSLLASLAGRVIANELN